MADERRHDNFPWWQRGIIYHIYPRSFQDSNGDGIGDLHGILNRLDYLVWLGIDAIWLSPIYPSPMIDFGYDVTSYTAIDPIFGDLATFDELVARAHAHNIRIIMDYVANHTSDQHPWFRASRSSRTNPQRDWYIWADPRPDGSPPNNWLSHWGGSAWEWDETTGQYYLHMFHTTMPDLNWRNPAVKAAMLDVLRFWLDRGVDGFRIDAVAQIMKDPQFRDNPPNPAATASQPPTIPQTPTSPQVPGAPDKTSPSIPRPLKEYDTQLHLYDRDHPDIHPILRELRRVLDTYNGQWPRLACAETRVASWQRWAAYYGTTLDELHIPFNFGLIHTPWTAQAVRHLVDTIEASLPPGAWPNYVLSTHDDPRLATRIGPQQARVAILLQLTLRGTPILYYGDEIGMHDIPIPPERVRDRWANRDPARTPMQWNSTPNAGFCPPDVEPWLPIAPDYPQINVAAARADPHSLLTLTHTLITLRRTTPALAIGSYHPIDSAPETCFAYLRQFGSQRRLIALNFTGNTLTLQLPHLGRGRILLSTWLDREEDVDLAALRLRGHEGCIIQPSPGPRTPGT
jgi:alpha-glucosidase